MWPNMMVEVVRRPTSWAGHIHNTAAAAARVSKSARKKNSGSSSGGMIVGSCKHNVRKYLQCQQQSRPGSTATPRSGVQAKQSSTRLIILTCFQHLQPLLCVDLVRAQQCPHSIIQHLSSSARQAAQTSCLQHSQVLTQRHTQCGCTLHTTKYTISTGCVCHVR